VPLLGPLKRSDEQASVAFGADRDAAPEPSPEAAASFSGDASHFLTLYVDERGEIERAECADRHVRRLWQARAGEPLRTYLGRWDPSTATSVDAAFTERRHVAGEFFARVGARVWLCAIEYLPDADGPRGVVRLQLHAESSRAPDQVFETALRLQQQAGLGHTILSELNQDRDLQQGLSTMLPHLLNALSMDAGAVFVCRDARAARLMAIHGSTHQRGYPYEDLDLTDPALVHLAQQPQVSVLQPHDAMQRGLKAVMSRGFRYGVLAPAIAGHAVSAYVAVSSSRGRELSLDSARALATACEAIGPLVHSHVLVERSQRDQAILHSSQAVLHTISQSLDLNETYQEIAISAVATVSGSSCLLLELSTDTGDLVTVAASEPDASSLIGLRVRFRTGQNLATLLQNRRSILVDDLIAGAGVDAEARRLLNLRSALIVPVLAQGELIGSLVIYSVGRRRRYSEQDMARAGEVAEQAAIAIHNARLYRDLMRSRESIQSLAHRIVEIRQDERQTFASVVHDDIIQSVVGARYLLESFLRRHPDESAEILDEAVGVLQQTVDDARRIVWELRPPVLDELGLEASLSALGQHLGNTRGSTLVHTRIKEIPALNRETATAVYKVAREATLNASRHAEASHIWITLEDVEDGAGKSARLNVRDDGVGFSVTSMRKEAHFGCAMMEEQATVIGARLSLESAPGAGTVVTLDVPLSR
jgi:two-component system NarL family sensor kinase